MDRHCKGIGIILVVLGHTLVPQVRETGFAGFYGYLYIIFICRYSSLSGYLFEKDFSLHEQRKIHTRKITISDVAVFDILNICIFIYRFSLKIPLLAKVLESGGYTAVDLKTQFCKLLHTITTLTSIYGLFFHCLLYSL